MIKEGNLNWDINPQVQLVRLNLDGEELFTMNLKQLAQFWFITAKVVMELTKLQQTDFNKMEILEDVEEMLHQRSNGGEETIAR